MTDRRASKIFSLCCEPGHRHIARDVLYRIALPATHLPRCGGFVRSVQVFDLTQLYDAIMPAQRRIT